MIQLHRPVRAAAAVAAAISMTTQQKMVPVVAPVEDTPAAVAAVAAVVTPILLVVALEEAAEQRILAVAAVEQREITSMEGPAVMQAVMVAILELEMGALQVLDHPPVRAAPVALKIPAAWEPVAAAAVVCMVRRR
jgi:hypothetical protein